MADPLAYWVRVPPKLPGRMGQAEELYRHARGPMLGLFTGWADEPKEEEVWWWELHASRVIRKSPNWRLRPPPDFDWANTQVDRILKQR